MQDYRSFQERDRRGGLSVIQLPKAPPSFIVPTMILRPKVSLHHHGAPLSTPAGLSATTVAAWLRRAVHDAQNIANNDVEDVALAAGAALGALDAVVRRQERWAGAWRYRLALVAAAVTARQMGRFEDEVALRDAVLLTRPGDEVGPAGRMLLAWRRLAARPAEDHLTEKSFAAVLEEFAYAPDAEEVGDLVDDLRRLSAGGMVGMVTGAFVAAEQYGFGRAVGAWLADALVAQRLGWPRAVPLLGGENISGAGSDRSRRVAAAPPPLGRKTEPEQTKILLAAQARAALRAVDLSAELERRAGKLLAVAPRLRAKAADAVVERLLSDDAIVASEKIAGMSDRGLRRLFDRLVSLSAVRELSGRAAFRIYGI